MLISRPHPPVKGDNRNRPAAIVTRVRKDLVPSGRVIILVPPVISMRILAILLAGVAIIPAFPQTPPKPARRGPPSNGATRSELGLLRAGFDLALLRASLPAMRMYAADLRAQEARLAAVRDYEAAIPVRDERQAVEREISRLEKEDLLLTTREQALRSALLPERIVLALDKAILSDVTYDPARKIITGWKRSGSGATWSFPALPPGGYEVVLRYSCDALEGGTILVRETIYTLSASMGTTLKGPVEKNIGTLKVSNGSGTLSILATNVLRDNLMNLHAVVLIPASH